MIAQKNDRLYTDKISCLKSKIENGFYKEPFVISKILYESCLGAKDFILSILALCLSWNYYKGYFPWGLG